MKFSEAMKLLEEGKKVRRVDWENKDVYIFIDKKGHLANLLGQDVCDIIDVTEGWEEYIDKQDIEEINSDGITSYEFCNKINEIIRVVNTLNKK